MGMINGMTNDELERIYEAIGYMEELARNDPDAAFEHIYEGGMINRDGSIHEELFQNTYNK